MSSQPSTEKQFYADAQAMFDELLRDAPTPPPSWATTATMIN